jgi:L-ascorbate metabolism protein UlaG (beta-lactamase superfamily)
VLPVKNAKAKITYLVHSGFAVETADHFFLFDYCPSMTGKPLITEELLKTKKNIYIFVSHVHGDHFDPAIFSWGKTIPSITYVLSSDIDFAPGALKCHVMSAYEQWKDGGVEVKSFGSTDAGISFLVKVDNLSIFHAGDLNWWRWKGETEAEQEAAGNNFQAEMAKMAGAKIDIAFFPVDRRLEEYYSLGAEYFSGKFHPKLLIPMHFGGDFAATKLFLAKAGAISQPTVEITHEGQEILY